MIGLLNGHDLTFISRLNKKKETKISFLLVWFIVSISTIDLFNQTDIFIFIISLFKVTN